MNVHKAYYEYPDIFSCTDRRNLPFIPDKIDQYYTTFFFFKRKLRAFIQADVEYLGRKYTRRIACTTHLYARTRRMGDKIYNDRSIHKHHNVEMKPNNLFHGNQPCGVAKKIMIERWEKSRTGEHSTLRNMVNRFSTLLYCAYYGFYIKKNIL